jgi:ligand-binding SRPBCC domain-containing protein
MIRFRTLRSSQWIPRSPAEVFAFFSDAHKLEEITPSWLNFRIMTPGPIEIKPGTEILYKLLWHGIPMKWVTQIRRWEPPEAFVDVQLSGPYHLWHHTHRFKSEGNGTRMTDVVRYSLPFGILGSFIDQWQTRHDVEKIFAYRFRCIEATFGHG